jgi:hypothetical protein
VASNLIKHHVERSLHLLYLLVVKLAHVIALFLLDHVDRWRRCSIDLASLEWDDRDCFQMERCGRRKQLADERCRPDTRVKYIALFSYFGVDMCRNMLFSRVQSFGINDHLYYHVCRFYW